LKVKLGGEMERDGDMTRLKSGSLRGGTGVVRPVISGKREAWRVSGDWGFVWDFNCRVARVECERGRLLDGGLFSASNCSVRGKV
jgi:hypothetical protein